MGGALTDRFGRRKMIIFSLVASSLSTAAMGLVDSLEGFYIIGVVSGLFTDVGGPAQQAIMADILPEEKRAQGFGILRVTFNLAVVFGPIIGGLVAARSYTALFLMDAVISIVSATIVYFNIPETKPAPHPHEEPETFGRTFIGYGRVIRDAVFMLFIVASMLSGLVYMNMNTTLGVFLRDNYGIPEDGYAYILSINAAMVVLFQFWITRRIEKLPPMLVMAAGTALYAIGFAMYGFVGNYGMFVMAMVVITIGEMLVAPVGQALVVSFAPEQMRGRYSAVFGILAWGVPFAVGPLLAGQIIDNVDSNWLWYACGIVGTLSVLVVPLPPSSILPLTLLGRHLRCRPNAFKAQMLVNFPYEKSHGYSNLQPRSLGPRSGGQSKSMDTACPIRGNRGRTPRGLVSGIDRK
jgi:MFS family permease